MGTSTRNIGQNGHNPLIPTWLECDPLPTPEYTTPEEIGAVPEQHGQPQQSIIPEMKIPPEADPNRFRGSRVSFTHFVNGGGRNSRSLKNSVANYIRRSLGGSTNATKRLGVARTNTAGLYGILHTFVETDGLQRVAQFLSLETLKGLPASRFFIRLAEFICPDGGPEDEGISRSAYYDTLADNPEIMGKSTENLTKDEINSIVQRYMTKVVMHQVLNGIANKFIRLPDKLEEITHIEDAVEQLIAQSVSDACAQVEQEHGEMTNERAKEITDRIYLKVFQILERVGE